MNSYGLSNITVLTPQHIQDLNDAYRKLNELLPILDSAQACGIDVSQLRATRDEMVRSIDNLRANFFNGQTRP